MPPFIRVLDDSPTPKRNDVSSAKAESEPNALRVVRDLWSVNPSEPSRTATWLEEHVILLVSVWAALIVVPALAYYGLWVWKRRGRRSCTTHVDNRMWFSLENCWPDRMWRFMKRASGANHHSTRDLKMSGGHHSDTRATRNIPSVPIPSYGATLADILRDLEIHRTIRPPMLGGRSKRSETGSHGRQPRRPMPSHDSMARRDPQPDSTLRDSAIHKDEYPPCAGFSVERSQSVGDSCGWESRPNTNKVQELRDDDQIQHPDSALTKDSSTSLLTEFDPAKWLMESRCDDRKITGDRSEQGSPRRSGSRSIDCQNVGQGLCDREARVPGRATTSTQKFSKSDITDSDIHRLLRQSANPGGVFSKCLLGFMKRLPFARLLSQQSNVDQVAWGSKGQTNESHNSTDSGEAPESSPSTIHWSKKSSKISSHTQNGDDEDRPVLPFDLDRLQGAGHFVWAHSKVRINQSNCPERFSRGSAGGSARSSLKPPLKPSLVASRRLYDLPHMTTLNTRDQHFKSPKSIPRGEQRLSLRPAKQVRGRKKRVHDKVLREPSEREDRLTCGEEASGLKQIDLNIPSVHAQPTAQTRDGVPRGSIPIHHSMQCPGDGFDVRTRIHSVPSAPQNDSFLHPHDALRPRRFPPTSSKENLVAFQTQHMALSSPELALHTRGG